MNCERFRDWLLLRDSGELSERRGKELEGHLAGCAACRAFEEESRLLTALFRERVVCGATPESTHGVVANCAREEVRTGRVIPFARVRVVQWAGLAALLLAVLSLFLWRESAGPLEGRQTAQVEAGAEALLPWSDPLAEDFESIGESILLAMLEIERDIWGLDALDLEELFLEPDEKERQT